MVARIPPRFELKYTVPDWRAAQVRDALAATCHLDPFCEQAPAHRYAIGSLYLDGFDFPFHRAKKNRQPQRLKLRVRHYPEAPDAGCFIEIKRRVGDVIVKRRQHLAADVDWAPIVRGEVPARTSVEADFADVLALHDATPALYVHYRREAWVSDIDEYGRVTFDSMIAYATHRDWSLPTPDVELHPVDDPAALGTPASFVVIEMKFAERMPLWMESLTARFDLFRRGFSKYCTSVEREWIDSANLHPGRRASVPRLGPR